MSDSETESCPSYKDINMGPKYKVFSSLVYEIFNPLSSLVALMHHMIYFEYNSLNNHITHHNKDVLYFRLSCYSLILYKIMAF